MTPDKIYVKTGRIFYGVSIAAMGLLTIFRRDFPYMLIPSRHTWVREHVLLVYIAGVLLLLAGACIALGKKVSRVSFLLGTALLLVFFFYFIPYELTVSTNYMHFGDWENAAKELGLAGGALTIAKYYSNRILPAGLSGKLMSLGVTIYALTILSFAIDHYLYARQAVGYVPSWVSHPVFWLYFTGTCLLGSSLAILFRFNRRLFAALLGLMILIWVIILHIPYVIASSGSEGEVTSAFLALALCGIAFFISGASLSGRKKLLSVFKRSVAIFLCLVVVTGGRSYAQHSYPVSYRVLKEYEGLYQYANPSTLKMAASPNDTLLYAIINQSRYPLRPVAKDVFVNSGNEPVAFLRSAKGLVDGFVTGKDTFRLLSKAVFFPRKMWYPRMVPDPKHYAYRYAPPPDLHDGLSTGNLNGTGLDPALLSAMVERIVRGVYPNVHGILIIKDHKLVFEEYFYEYTRDSLQEMRSATKSVISALVGIAIHQGLLPGVGAKLRTLFPEYRFANPSPLKDRITVADLLDNQSGVNYDEAWDKSMGTEAAMDHANDWVKYTFDLPMLDTPGTKGRYNSGNPITLGRLVEKVAGMPLSQYANANLFRPLQITRFKWNFKPDRSNEENFCQLYLTPRSMAKFGLLYLQDGLWKGRPVIPAGWVKESTSKHSVVQNVDYGYLWWLKYLDAGTTRYHSFAAQGNGGQKIYVFRALDMVVVTTGGNFNSQSPADELIKKYILPAFNKG